METSCPHCGKPLDHERCDVHEIDMESAAVELVLAQMARIYRTATGKAYATSGDGDTDAIRLNLFEWNDRDSPADSMTVSGILKNWKRYVEMSGERADVETFFYTWLPASKESAEVIPFRPRYSQA